MSLSFGEARSWRYQNKQCSETQTVVRNDCMAIINRNTPYFNHTRSTVNKVSTNLVQTAKLSFIPKSMVDYLAKDNLRPPVLALSSRQVKIKLSTAAR